MEGVPVAVRNCPGIRYLRGLSQRFQSIGYSPWTRSPKASVHSHLVHLPQTPVLQCGPEVDLGLKEYVSFGCTEAIDVDFKPNVEVSTSLISLPSNSDHQFVATVGPETANMEEILMCLRSHGVLRCDPDPQMIPKPIHRPGSTVPPRFERLTSNCTNRYLRCLHPRPTHPSVGTVPQGLEPLSSVTGIVQSDTASNIEFDLGSTSLPPRQVHVSGSPMSIGYNTTDSDGISEPEIIRDTTRLARTAVLASGAELQQSLDQLLFTRFNKVLNDSESSDHNGKWGFIRAEGNSHLVHAPYKTVSASCNEVAPHLAHIATFASSDRSDCDILPEAEGSRNLVDAKVRAAALGSGEEVASEKSLISLSYSESNSNITDSDVPLDCDKRSFKYELTETAAGPANSSTGACAGVKVAEEPETRGADCKDSGAAFHPDKRSFKYEVKEIPSGPANSSTGACAGVKVAEEPETRGADCKDSGAAFHPDKRRFKCEVKEIPCGLANSSTGARASVLVAQEPKLRETDGKDTGGAQYPYKRSFKYVVKESARDQANTSTKTHAGVLVAKEPKTRTAYKDFGAALYHKRSFKYVIDESASGPANLSVGARAGVLVAQEPNTRRTDCKDFRSALRASTSEGVASRFMLNPNAKEFVPRASKSGSFLAPNAKEFVPRAPKSGDLLAECGPASPRLQKYKLFGVELTHCSAEAKARARAFSAPAHAPLDLGTALRMNHENRGWVKWSKTKQFVPLSDADVVWGSGRGKVSTDKSAPVQDLKLPSRNKSTTTPAREFNGKKRPACHTDRPMYPAKPYCKVSNYMRRR